MTLDSHKVYTVFKGSENKYKLLLEVIMIVAESINPNPSILEFIHDLKYMERATSEYLRKTTEQNISLRDRLQQIRTQNESFFIAQMDKVKELVSAAKAIDAIRIAELLVGAGFDFGKNQETEQLAVDLEQKSFAANTPALVDAFENGNSSFPEALQKLIKSRWNKDGVPEILEKHVPKTTPSYRPLMLRKRRSLRNAMLNPIRVLNTIV